MPCAQEGRRTRHEDGKQKQRESTPILCSADLLPLPRPSAHRLTRIPDWAEEETEAAGGSGGTEHLWEESWDDDDTNDDFSAQLKCVFPRASLSKTSTSSRLFDTTYPPHWTRRLTHNREELKKVEASKRR